MNIKQKTLYFEFILNELIKRQTTMYPNLTYESILTSYTRLKALKLLFLICGANPNKNEPSLLDYFNNYYAMQHGPVESDIYNAMVKNTTIFFDFSNRETSLKVKSIAEDSFKSINVIMKDLVNKSIDYALQENINLLKERPYRLVEITHKWSSWKTSYNIACILGKHSEKMNIDNIKKDVKFFS